jgi:hypothetical protein
VDRVNVSYDTAGALGPGDHVTLTWWRGDLMTVASRQYRADEGVPSPGTTAGLVVFCILAAGSFAVFLLVRHPRDGRPVTAADPAQASVSLFLNPLLVTALWTLPLAGSRPGRAVAGPVTAAGVLLVLALLAHAWPMSGRTLPVEPRPLPEGEDVFLPATFLPDTPAGRRLAGTHIVLGAGPMAVLPHGGPGRFAAKEIPVGGFTVQQMRRPERTTERNVPAHWYVAELLCSGHPVTLAAAPADLLLLVGELVRTAPPPSRTM